MEPHTSLLCPSSSNPFNSRYPLARHYDIRSLSPSRLHQLNATSYSRLPHPSFPQSSSSDGRPTPYISRIRNLLGILLILMNSAFRDWKIWKSFLSHFLTFPRPDKYKVAHRLVSHNTADARVKEASLSESKEKLYELIKLAITKYNKFKLNTIGR